MVVGTAKQRCEWHIQKARKMIRNAKEDPDFKGSWLMTAKQHVDLAEKAYNDYKAVYDLNEILSKEDINGQTGWEWLQNEKNM